jgi:SAM-dependent methyltransferase
MHSSNASWFEDESFWERTFPFMFPEVSFTAAAENVPKIVALTGVQSGSILDLACGPGRYAIPLAKAGFAVTGVDRTRFLLDKARERAGREGVAVEWVRSDMRDFARPGAFDLALNLFTSFGYFDDEAENRRVLENICASLKPGGTFVFDHLGKELLAERFAATHSDSLSDGTALIHRNQIVDDWSRIEGEWILLEGDRAQTFQLRHWLYSGRELRQLLSSVGFAEIKLFGDFNQAPYGPNAQRLIAMARKPALPPTDAR